MITLVTSRICSKRPDFLLLMDFEKFCLQNTSWKIAQGAKLFSSIKVSSRFYTFLHRILCPILKIYRKKGAVVSLGLPYPLYLYSKTFPYFTFKSDLRVLWTYDVWEPNFEMFESLVRDSEINLLFLSSLQATEHFQQLNIPNCKVEWVHESINPSDYKCKLWNERSINVISFGRSYERYHHEIYEGCKEFKINYQFEDRADKKDVAAVRVKPSTLQFPTWKSFVTGLSNSQVCVCFPKSITHPKQVGNTSTLTLRYLQAMASKCLLLGTAPHDLKYILNYNPVIEVDWNNPVEQIRNILDNPSSYEALIEKNYTSVCNHFHSKNAVEKMHKIISDCLSLQL